MLEKFADRVGHVHLKNMRMPLVEKARAEHWSFLDAVRAGAFTVPGDPDGCVEFDAVFDLLDKAGYTGWIMVEAEQDPPRLIRSSTLRWAVSTSLHTPVWAARLF